MSFALHAQAYGVLVEDLSPSNRIRRCGTSTHPKSKNGAYTWDGKRGWVMNWSDGELHVFGSTKEFSEEDKKEWLKRKRETEQQLNRAYENAALKASIILRDAPLSEHPYLCNKGFPEERGFVDEAGKLLIPMRDWQTDKLNGIQTIEWLSDERKFKKKMQHGMKAKGAIFRFGNKRLPETILCEGYITGLSIRYALSKLHLKASVTVCFSDSNMTYVAGLLGGRKMIYADNDKSGAGEAAAKKTGLPYVMSDKIGNDANDDHLERGILYVSQKVLALRKIVL